jgi:hypothetical protein
MSRILFSLFLCALTLSYAANIRGRIDQPMGVTKKTFPSKGIIVDLVGKRKDLSKDSLYARFVTSADGMYYFREVTPGTYKLALNGHIAVPSLVVSSDTTYQDQPPLMIK